MAPEINAYHRALKRLLQRYQEVSSTYDPLYDMQLDDAVIAAKAILDEDDDRLTEEYSLLVRVSNAAGAVVDRGDESTLRKLSRVIAELRVFRRAKGYF